jgi:hypothetical protein
MEDRSDRLLNDIEYFSEEFLEKLDSYLDENLTVDDVLDRISEVGLPNITVFEKYFLDKHKDDEQD